LRRAESENCDLCRLALGLGLGLGHAWVTQGSNGKSALFATQVGKGRVGEEKQIAEIAKIRVIAKIEDQKK
jgi:hypothetical protein